LAQTFVDGQILDAADLNDNMMQRVGQQVFTSDSSTFTAETQIMTVTVTLVSGRKYRVQGEVSMTSSVAGDVIGMTLREDSASGTVMVAENMVRATSVSPRFHAFAEYIAVSSGSKTFSMTGQKVAGTGLINRSASATLPAYLIVTYIG
jgi:hypothetical protein